MTIRIPCPTCGPRSIEEWFHADVIDVPASITDPDERDVDQGYMKNNTEGIVREAWFHAAGCRRWFVFERDTTTDRFVAASGD